MKISRGDSLDRYYLLKFCGFGAFLHKIHHSDPEGVYHSHPWNGISFIFGRYWECYRDDPVIRRRCFFNIVRARRHHRTIVNRPTWTLFIHGRKCNKWSIVDAAGREASEAWEGSEGHKSYSAALTK